MATTVAAALADGTRRIAATLGLEPGEARLEARVLATSAWHVAPAWLIAHDTDVLPREQSERFEQLLLRRLAGEPVAYILGEREFYGRRFHVSSHVLIPRPDTELLVELALQRLPTDSSADVLDLGTGSGCVAITLALERPHARVTAVDRSSASLKLARLNAANLDAPVEFLDSDWFEALGDRRFDLIVSNPPYIAHADPHLARGDVRFEPLSALVAGYDGLDDLRRLVARAPRHLRRGSVVLLEHGYDQADAVCALLREAGFTGVQSWRDLGGNPRVSGGRLSE